MKSRVLFIVFLLLATAPANPQSNRPRVSILCVPGLSADDIKQPEMQYMRQIVPEAVVGWMNVRTARVAGTRDDQRTSSEIEASSYLTLGAGSRALAPDSAGGDLSKLKSANSKLDHLVQPGLLGSLLHSDGLRTFLTGNDDTDRPGRSASFMIIDGNGALDSPPNFQGATVRDESAPYGFRSLGPSAVARILSEVDVYVFGDLARAKQYAPLCLPEMARKHRTQALKRLDGAIAAWWNIDAFPGTLRILLAPCPPVNAPPGDRLAPLLISGGEFRAGGQLTSGSTRTDGLVANTDFLPTIAAWLKIKPAVGLVGRPITRTEFSGNIDTWAAMHVDWMETSHRQAIYGGLPVLQFGIVLASTVCWLNRKRWAAKIEPLVSSLPIAIIALPLTLLILPILGAYPRWGEGLELSGLLALAVVYAYRSTKGIARLVAVVVGGTVLLIAADLLSGAHLQRVAPMSYSVMEGARYYGIGNEYAGALAGCAMVFALYSKLAARYWKLFVAGLVLLAFVVGHPSLGANIGGMAGMAAAAVGFALLRSRGKLVILDLLIFAGLLIALLIIVFLLDTGRSADAQSHFARAFSSSSGLAAIASRKVSLNLYLLANSPWSLGLFGAILASAVIWNGLPNEAQMQLNSDHQAIAVFWGAVFGALALLIFNDSGVVAASECLMVFWSGAFFTLRMPVELSNRRPNLDKPPGQRHTVRKYKTRKGNIIPG